MKEMTCPKCGKFIGVLDGEAQIKCPLCKHLATYRSNPAPEQDPVQDPEHETEEESSAVH